MQAKYQIIDAALAGDVVAIVLPFARAFKVLPKLAALRLGKVELVGFDNRAHGQLEESDGFCRRRK